ncbi:hypothetical protein [Pseudomarimonas salicorniae]|uniref:Uncharacterized protein n=1 Tax=Pseudomarimonas salicorniae TaxID=2933270 RepID=A0ABT0GIQ5_9GAMM|nr:hypothetical protein [Lysobacter sp. CAU 1642]MCK7594426.1 hypothetical protein [Lysobacter sp. CAU 1642]
MRTQASFAALALLLVGLAGCGSKDPADTAEAAKEMGPAETVAQQAKELREGDFVSLIQLAVPPAQYEKMKAEWPKRVKEDPATEEDKQQFAETMAKVTAADAEATLYAELEPQLAKAEAEMGAQLPLMVGMGRGFAVQAINESAKLSAAQKQQATDFIDAFAKWLEGAQFFDRDKARQALSSMVGTARKLGVKTLDEVEAMDFETAMQKAGMVFLGVKDVLKVYGLDLDQSLASVKSEVKSQSGDQAVVQVNYELLGQPLSFETTMTQRDGRWYGAEALQEIEKSLDEPAAPAVEEAPAEASDTAPAASGG